MIDDIPTPIVLDPDRVLRDDRADMTAEDHRSQAHMLDAALHETAEYATQLWHDLAAMRQYLVDILPAEPTHGVAAGGASPVGPDDEQGWTYWADAYAEVTSVLCGPKGDNGYGRSSATVMAQLRRDTSAPATEPTAAAPDPETPPGRRPGDDAQVDVAADSEASDPPPALTSRAASPRAASPRKGVDATSFLAPLGYAAAGALGAVLTLRNRLRPRR